jgi:hypothetical protein
MTKKWKIFVLVLLTFFLSFSRDPFTWIGSTIEFPDVSENVNVFNLNAHPDKLICVFLYLDNDDDSDKMVPIYNRAYNLFKTSDNVTFYRFPALCCISHVVATNIVPKIIILEHDETNETSQIFENKATGFKGELVGIKTYEEVINFIQSTINNYVSS